MKKAGNVIFCFVLVLAFVTSAHAQEEAYGPEQGDFSVVPSFGLMNSSGSTTLIINSTCGYYLTEFLEVGLDIFTVGSWTDEFDTMLLGINPMATYHFLLGDIGLVPFVGAGAGLLYAKASTENPKFEASSTNFDIQFFGGLDYFFTENAALRATFRDRLVFGSGSSTNMFELLIGANLLF